MNNETIHGKSEYLKYQFDLWEIPVLIAAIPALYIIPTILVVIKIIRVYIEHVLVKKDDIINPHVFSVIVLQLVLCFLYMLADYSTIRLPSTGLLTTCCASQQPNHGLKILYFLSLCARIVRICLPQLRSKRESKNIQKAELSLTFTTLSMLIAHITNLALVAVAIFQPSFSAYLVAIRPYGNDCDFVFVPWIFYMTHSIFKTSNVEPNEETRAKRIPVTL